MEIFIFLFFFKYGQNVVGAMIVDIINCWLFVFFFNFITCGWGCYDRIFHKYFAGGIWEDSVCNEPGSIWIMISDCACSYDGMRNI